MSLARLFAIPPTRTGWTVEQSKSQCIDRPGGIGSDRLSKGTADGIA